MTMVFANFPVKDLEKSTAFYESLGFEKNQEFSDDHASSMSWDENFVIMLLKHDFYQKFIQNRQIADAHKTSGALIAFSMNSADEVRQFGEKAQLNGGSAYHVDMGIPEEYMYGLEVLDLDGNTLEPMWMKMD
ncbi:VOC family protein [Enterococcus sp. LJL99]